MLYTEDIYPLVSTLSDSRKKMQTIDQILLKESNCDHKFLRCPDLQDNNFEVIHLEITFNKVCLDCAGTVKAKHTGTYSVFITYSNTINLASKWLYNRVYIITQCQKLVK